jgi:exonuclease VII large subunit
VEKATAGLGSFVQIAGLMVILEGEKAAFEQMVSRYDPTTNKMADDDRGACRQQIDHVRDLLSESGLIDYSHLIVKLCSAGLIPALR